MISPIGGNSNTNNNFSAPITTSRSNTSSFNPQSNNWGITDEQKKYFKKKYGSEHLSLQGEATKELMSELKDLGVISNRDYSLYSVPQWLVGEDGFSDSTVLVVDCFNDDIRETFKILEQEQYKESLKTVGNSRQDYLYRQDMYKNLAGLMDYIFS